MICILIVRKFIIESYLVGVANTNLGTWDKMLMAYLARNCNLYGTSQQYVL